MQYLIVSIGKKLNDLKGAYKMLVDILLVCAIIFVDARYYVKCDRLEKELIDMKDILNEINTK